MKELWLLLGVVFFIAPCAVAGQTDSQDQEPPQEDRPKNFSWVVGNYRDGITRSASLEELYVEDPLLLTVRITGSGSKKYQPQRQNLRLFAPDLDRDFYLEGIPEKDRYLPQERTWEFVYRLKPKHLNVNKVPSLKLVYYNPQTEKYQTAYADKKIPLKVKARPQVQAPQEAVKVVRAPEEMYKLTTGTAVLERATEGIPAIALGGLLFVTPPLLCGLWYLLWQRLYPDAARLTRLRRRRAAHKALQALRSVQTPADGERTSIIVTDYLRQRLDLPPIEATPAEVAQHLCRAGIPSALAQQVAGFFRVCDAVRFAPTGLRSEDNLATDATQLILALEANHVRPWPPERLAIAGALSV